MRSSRPVREEAKTGRSSAQPAASSRRTLRLWLTPHRNACMVVQSSSVALFSPSGTPTSVIAETQGLGLPTMAKGYSTFTRTIRTHLGLFRVASSFPRAEFHIPCSWIYQEGETCYSVYKEASPMMLAHSFFYLCAFQGS